MQAQAGNRSDEYDVIVVGGGVGGCIMAARIAQFGVHPTNGEKLRVALFEWGPYHKGDSVRGYGIPSRRAAFDNLPFEVARRYTLPWGALGMIGGSTQWAGMIAHPPIPIDFEHWRAETGVNWTWEKFNLPLAEMYEMWHPYPEPPEVRTPGQQKFKQVALSLGYEVVEIGQAKMNCVRCGDCIGRVCKYDAKATPLVNYVPIAEREGVHFFPNTPIEKVVIEKKGARPVATGVVYRQDGELRQARAGKVVVSCGGTGTPLLLYRSGYGPREKVKGELLAENRNVGANVSTSIKTQNVQGLFEEATKHPDIGVHGVYGVEKVYGPHGYLHLFVAENFGDKEGQGTNPQDFVSNPLAPPFGREFKQFMKIASTHTGNLKIELSKNKLRGEIDAEGRTVFGAGGSAAGEGGESEGLITRAYLEKNHPETMEPLREAIEIAKKIMNGIGPPRKMAGDLEVPEQMRAGNWIGSCRAGESRENSVVNSDLESHDVDNLVICDGSVIPSQCRYNPSMPIATVSNYAWRRMVANHFSRG